MPVLSESPAASPASTFAGFLARFAAPPIQPVDRWNDDALADDIATLSYEQALRTHARNRPPCPSSPPQETEPGSRLHTPAAISAQSETAAGPAFSSSSLDENRRSSSVTIRLSHTEYEQLRTRAADAGLTVSAYLRSCIFEVETLRAQVKDTLAQLRSTPAQVPQRRNDSTPSSHRWRFFAPWSARRRTASV
ncbi:MAG: hypothetical protein WCC26_07455 [Terracidiphilus sp.]